MTSVGVYDAKTQLPKLLDKVARGHRITITRHGVPVAMLIPAGSSSAQSRTDVIAELRALRKRHRLRGLSLRAMIRQGRR